MFNKEPNQIESHGAGAIVRHKSPFSDLKSFRNDFKLTQAYIDKWVVPFYMNIGTIDDDDWIRTLILIKKEITPEIIQTSLGDFNWRPRQTGAFFAAISNQTQFIEIIGVHLLKSEVCYAGDVYCQVLASFNTPDCIEYLNRYLDYYLTKPELYFNQRSAMEAILYLDKINSTHHFDLHFDKWNQFVSDEPHGDKEINTELFEKKLAVIQEVRQS